MCEAYSLTPVKILCAAESCVSGTTKYCVFDGKKNKNCIDASGSVSLRVCVQTVNFVSTFLILGVQRRRKLDARLRVRIVVLVPVFFETRIDLIS